ncbi:MAG: hypothetical protein KBT00_05390 [Bacteroidales bacterium]|nr:hypothetical protein [Candidatus Cacconaster merdequi]
MKSILKYSACGLLILLYITSYMGFGVHSCHSEGSKFLVLMFGDTSDEAIHRSHCDHHHDTHQQCPHRNVHNCNGCHGCDALAQADECDTALYVVSDAQDSSDSSAKILPTVATEDILLIASDNVKLCATPQLYKAVPPRSPSVPLLSVWRL